MAAPKFIPCPDFPAVEIRSVDHKHHFIVEVRGKPDDLVTGGWATAEMLAPSKSSRRRRDSLGRHYMRDAAPKGLAALRWHFATLPELATIRGAAETLQRPTENVSRSRPQLARRLEQRYPGVRVQAVLQETDLGTTQTVTFEAPRQILLRHGLTSPAVFERDASSHCFSHPITTDTGTILHVHEIDGGPCKAIHHTPVDPEDRTLPKWAEAKAASIWRQLHRRAKST